MKEFLLVGIGSFFGGGMRYLVSKVVMQLVPFAFPLGTMTVNLVGCLVIGVLSAMPWTSGTMSQSTKMILTTGFCGGFTTFSTFMNEGSAMMKSGLWFEMAMYVAGSVVLGMLAVAAGYYIGEHFVFNSKTI